MASTAARSATRWRLILVAPRPPRSASVAGSARHRDSPHVFRHGRRGVGGAARSQGNRDGGFDTWGFLLTGKNCTATFLCCTATSCLLQCNFCVCCTATSCLLQYVAVQLFAFVVFLRCSAKAALQLRVSCSAVSRLLHCSVLLFLVCFALQFLSRADMFSQTPIYQTPMFVLLTRP